MDNRLCTLLNVGTKTGRQSLPCQDQSPARGKMPPSKGGKGSLPPKCFHTDLYSNSGDVRLIIPPPFSLQPIVILHLFDSGTEIYTLMILLYTVHNLLQDILVISQYLYVIRLLHICGQNLIRCMKTEKKRRRKKTTHL